MIYIITGIDEKLINTREVIYGVDSYDYVYERMIDSMFSTVENIKEFYPNAEWNLVMLSNPVKSSNLRPDTVIIRTDPVSKQKNVYIIDAKYYRYGTTFKPSDLPETTSIQKQITYGEYVKAAKNGQYNKVYSAFLLPYSRDMNIYKDRFHRYLEYVGKGKATWFAEEDNARESNRDIAAILIDTKYLVHNWVKKDEDKISNLTRLIEYYVQLL